MVLTRGVWAAHRRHLPVGFELFTDGIYPGVWAVHRWYLPVGFELLTDYFFFTYPWGLSCSQTALTRGVWAAHRRHLPMGFELLKDYFFSLTRGVWAAHRLLFLTYPWGLSCSQTGVIGGCGHSAHGLPGGAAVAAPPGPLSLCQGDVGTWSASARPMSLEMSRDALLPIQSFAILNTKVGKRLKCCWEFMFLNHLW